MGLQDRRELKCERNGNWAGRGIAYGPQRDRHTPTSLEQPTHRELFEDLLLISKQWHMLRVYRSSQTTENILWLIRQENLPVRVLLGLWVVEAEGDVNREHNRFSVENAVRLANQYSEEVIGVSVGNEIFVDWSAHRIRNKAPIVDIIRFIRSRIVQPVTVADDYNFWNKPESQEIAAELDFLMLHVHPAWNGKSVGEATAFVRDTYRHIQMLHPGIPVILGECGWPTDYNPAKDGPGEQGALIRGEVSEAAQAKFYSEFIDWIDAEQIPTFFFEAFDEIWKGGGAASGPHEVEKHWGVFKAGRRPKASVRDLFPEMVLEAVASQASKFNEND